MENEIKMQKRFHSMDMLRGLAIILVIGWHVVSIPQLYGTPMPSSVEKFFAVLSPVRIPLLFFLSGMLLPRSLSKSLTAYVAGKLKGVLWPYVIWTVLTCLAASSLMGLLNFWYWVAGAFHMWYLSTLFILYIFGVAGRFIPMFGMVALMLVSFIFLGPRLDSLVTEFYYGIIFFAGAAFVKYIDCFVGSNLWVPMILLMISLFALFAGLDWVHYEQSLEYLIFGVPLILVIIWCASKLPRIHWLEVTGRESIIFYVVHFPAIVIAYRLSQHLDLQYWLMVALCAGAGFGISYIFYLLRNQLRFLFRFPDKRALKRM